MTIVIKFLPPPCALEKLQSRLVLHQHCLTRDVWSALCRALACSSSPFTSHSPPVMDQKLTSVPLAITHCPYAVWEEWERMTSFWPSAAPPLPSPSSLSPALPISLRGLERCCLGVFVSSAHKLSSVCAVCFSSVSIATFRSSYFFACRIFRNAEKTGKTAVTSNRALRFYYIQYY